MTEDREDSPSGQVHPWPAPPAHPPPHRDAWARFVETAERLKLIQGLVGGLVITTLLAIWGARGWVDGVASKEDLPIHR